MVSNLVRSSQSAASNARMSIGSVVGEVKEDESVQQRHGDVEMAGVEQDFHTTPVEHEEANSIHPFS
jgi:hypothetical protein